MAMHDKVDHIESLKMMSAFVVVCTFSSLFLSLCVLIVLLCIAFLLVNFLFFGNSCLFLSHF